ncbi:MAG TPA: C4-dicarboxylate ABC transporter substrate-binding protein, partial [Hyphomicrobiaceae bacterium]|nr:C4-dicarboxylate ABC transporter substrate-binding protein [Hyphomicrobiaceae bacterium]
MRPVACLGAVLAAALLAFPLAAGAQQPPQVKRPAPPPTPGARYASQRDTLNQNTVTVISGNPNGTYLYLAYDMSAVLDDGNDLRILPVIGKGGYQNVMDVLHLRGVDLCITQSNIMT